MRHLTTGSTVLWLAAVALALGGCKKSEDASVTQTGKAPELGAATSLGGIAVKAPADWKAGQPTSKMRKAQWTVGEGDKEAEMVVYYFGPQAAGSIEQNLDRWYGQFEQSDGKPSKDAARVSEQTVAGLKVTRLELGGRYVAAVRPGAAEKYDKPGYYMLAAIVEAPDGPYYLRMVGPEATMKAATPGFDAMLGAIQATGEKPAEDDSVAHPDPEQLRKMQERRKQDEEAAAKELARFTDELRKQAAALVAKKYKSDAKALDAILASPHRIPGNADRDEYRHPKETLLFLGIKPDMTVVEAGSGAGWYTEVLAPYLAQKGKLIVATYDPDAPLDSFRTILGLRTKDLLGKSPELFGKVEPVYIDPPDDIVLAPEGSVDAVLAFREMHNWIRNDMFDQYVTAVHKALKPGGVFGIVQHRARPDMKAEDSAQKGRLPEEWLVEKLKSMGFDLAEKSDINDNPKDTKDYEKGVWTLPPVLTEGDKDKDKYLAIGESDRMTLKFVKRK